MVPLLVDYTSPRGHLSPSSISIDFGWYAILRPASVDSHFNGHIQIYSVINFIEIINHAWALISTIPLGFWKIEIIDLIFDT